MNVAILISGTGSVMQAILQHFAICDKLKKITFFVITNNPNALGINKALQLGFKTITINHKDYKTRLDFDNALNAKLNDLQIDFVVLAGFMRILTPNFVSCWSGKMVNTHPSLLPAFKGAHAVKDAIDYGVKITGTTVHWVSPDVDAGKIIAQDFVFIETEETEESLHAKIKQKEQILYPKVLQSLLLAK